MMEKPLENALNIIIKVASPERVILFGSRAQNKHHQQSDYDLLVLKRDVKQKRKLAQEIYKNFRNIGAPVDVIVADLEKFEQLKNDPYMIYYDAHKFGKIIYEQ